MSCGIQYITLHSWGREQEIQKGSKRYTCRHAQKRIFLGISFTFKEQVMLVHFATIRITNWNVAWYNNYKESNQVGEMVWALRFNMHPAISSTSGLNKLLTRAYPLSQEDDEPGLSRELHAQRASLAWEKTWIEIKTICAKICCIQMYTVLCPQVKCFA